MKKVSGKYVWDENEIEFLRANYGVICNEDLGMRLGVSHATVRLKAIELNIEKKIATKTCVWTDEKLEYLREHYPYDTLSDVADHVGFSTYTVKKKVMELGLAKDDSFKKSNFYNRYVKNYKHDSSKSRRRAGSKT